MHPTTLVPDPFLQGGGERERSRRASERYLLLAAVAEQRQRTRPRPGPVRRFRHVLAGALAATARLVDAT